MDLFKRLEYNPTLQVKGEAVKWQSYRFQELLMGLSADGPGSMEMLKILSKLWSDAPSLVTVQQLGRLLGGVGSLGINAVEAEIRNVREFISREDYPLKGVVEIKNTSRGGYSLKPVSGQG